jgi:hypothetical protein
MQIKSITEAFAHVPITHEVISDAGYQKLVKENNALAKTAVKKILPSITQLGSSEQCDTFLVCNFQDKVMYRYLAKSVNVQYK